MDYLASLLVFLCALTDRIPAIISMTFPNGSLHSLTVVCIVLVSWQWKNDLISCLHFILVSWKWKNDFNFHVCIFIFGILAMEKRFNFLSAFLYLVSWKWKNVFYLLFMSALYWYPGNGKTNSFPCLCFYIGILAMEK
jgi:hypothetical protein